MIDAVKQIGAGRAANEGWAPDFASDVEAGGRRIRNLAVLDGYKRRCPGIEVGASIGSRRVPRPLERMIVRRGTPERLRCDNGPECRNQHLLAWCGRRAHRGRPSSAGEADRERTREQSAVLLAGVFALHCSDLASGMAEQAA